LESVLEDHEGEKSDATNALMAKMKYIQSLHNDCDWLIKYFDVRKTARTDEIDALGKARAVLSGADFSLLQTDRHARISRANFRGSRA